MTPGLDLLLKAGVRRSYQADNTIFFAGSEAKGLFYIVSGTVMVIGEGDDRCATHDFISAGEFVGELGLFAPQEARVRNATVRTRCQTTAIYITYDQVMEVAGQNPAVLMLIGSQIARRLALTTRRVRDMMFLDVKSRVYRVLLDLCTYPDAITHPDGMQLRITRGDIGLIAGCSREMAGRAVSSLAQEQKLTARGKTIVVFGTR